jgi:hypothetical protein
MTRTLAALAFALVFPLSAAQSEPKERFTPGLGEIMTLQQMRHLKLWYAGQAGNWPLAEYELDELKEGFEDIVKYHPTHDDVPTGTMATAVVDGEVAALNKAIGGGERPQAVHGGLRQAHGGLQRLPPGGQACLHRRPAPNRKSLYQPGVRTGAEQRNDVAQALKAT